MSRTLARYLYWPALIGAVGGLLVAAAAWLDLEPALALAGRLEIGLGVLAGVLLLALMLDSDARRMFDAYEAWKREQPRRSGLAWFAPFPLPDQFVDRRFALLFFWAGMQSWVLFLSLQPRLAWLSVICMAVCGLTLALTCREVSAGAAAEAVPEH